MKQISRFLALFPLALLLAGCWQKSVHPFYTSADLNQNSAIVGTWLEDDDDEPNPDAEKWIFTEPHPRKYLLQIIDGDKTYDYDVRLFRLDGTQFIDFHSLRRELSEIPAHHLFKADIQKGRLQLQMLNPEWVAENASRIEHITVQSGDDPDKKEVIITAKTPALQKFIRQNAKDPKFFTDPILFKPAPSAPTE